MGSEFKIRGSSLSSKFAFAEERFGDEAESQLKASFEKRKIFPILDAVWYPFSLYIEINEALAKQQFAGDLTRLREVGIYSAERALSATYRAYAQSGDFVGFLSQISALHNRFYSHGKMTVNLNADRCSCDILISDQPVYPQVEFYVAEGFYGGAAKHLGLTGVATRFKRVTAGALFQIKWTPMAT